MEQFLIAVERAVWSWPLLLLILGTGVYLTVLTRGIQIRRLGQALRCIFRSDSAEGSISPFAALCTSLSATIGTGNIIGVAAAVSLGGPGALVWMELSALTGMAVKYAEGVLAVRYRRSLPDGQTWGGPYAYIEQGLGRRFRPLAVAFAAFGAAAAVMGMGTFVQAGSITNAVRFFTAHYTGLSAAAQGTLCTILGIVLAVMTFCLISGGIRRIAAASAVLVPVMAALYLGCCLWIIGRHIAQLPDVLHAMFAGAFSGSAVAGGAVGGLLSAVQQGVSRGLFSNEAGLGTASIAAAAAKTDSPMRQGLVNMSATFFDTFLICTVTGVTVLLTGADREGGFSAVMLAFAGGLPLPDWVGAGIVLLCLVLFTFTTIIGWHYYGVECLHYLTGRSLRAARAYRVAYVLAVLVAPFLSISGVFAAANACNGLLAIPNLIAVALLARQVQQITLEGT